MARQQTNSDTKKCRHLWQRGKVKGEKGRRGEQDGHIDRRCAFSFRFHPTFLIIIYVMTHKQQQQQQQQMKQTLIDKT